MSNFQVTTPSTPLDIFYQGLITQLTSHWILDAYLKQNTLVHFDDKPDRPTKPRITSADVPELVVWLKGFRGDLIASSDHSKITPVYQVVISAGQWNSRLCHAVSWACLEVLMNWKEWAHPLSYNSQQGWLTDLRLNSGEVGFSNTKENRQIQGFVTVAEFEADIQLTNEIFEVVEP